MSPPTRSSAARRRLLMLRDAPPPVPLLLTSHQRAWYEAHTPLICDYLLDRLARDKGAGHPHTTTILHELVGCAAELGGFGAHGDVRAAWSEVHGLSLVVLSNAVSMLPARVTLATRVDWWIRFTEYLGARGMLSGYTQRRLQAELREVHAAWTKLDETVSDRHPPATPVVSAPRRRLVGVAA